MPSVAAARLLLAAALACALRAAAAAAAAAAAPQSDGKGRQSGKSAAILISGRYDQLLVTPLTENLVRANVEAGTPVDTYFMMKRPSQATEGSAKRYAVDPKVAEVYASRPSANELYGALCKWARGAGAGYCSSMPEAEEPLELPDDEPHAKIMSYYSPLLTEAGRSVLRRWRTVETLWAQAKQSERAHGFRYNSVLMVRDDTYWLTPYIFETVDFEAYPNSLKSTACLEAHGLNDRVLHLGRGAADQVATSYQAWREVPHSQLRETRNAEEFLFKLAMLRGVGLRPRGFSYALAATTVSGLPCFRRQSFNLTSRGGYHKCCDEAAESSPVTKLFRTFSCDAMSPAFYEKLGGRQVEALQGATARAAGTDDKQLPLILTAAGGASAESAVQTMRSLRAAHPLARAVVVAQEGVCKAFDELGERAVCIEVSQQVDDMEVRLALLSTALGSSRGRGIIFAEPGVIFQKDAIAAFQKAGSGRDVVFVPKRSAPCKEVHAGGDVSGKLFYVKDTPGGMHALMRAWMFLAEDPVPGGFFVGEQVASALEFQLPGRALQAGDVGTVRGASRKDAGRVVVDFPGVPGVSLHPRQLALKGASALLARAAAASTGVRGGATACGLPGWERLQPEAAS